MRSSTILALLLGAVAAAWFFLAPHNASPAEVSAALQHGAVVVDVRTPQEFAQDAVPGAVNIPVDQLPRRLSEVDPSKPVIVYCAAGTRSARAARVLREAGYTEVLDLGGRSAWPDDLHITK